LRRLSYELDGKTNEFGKRLLDIIEQDIGNSLCIGETDICEIVYQDRYLNSPLPVALLIDFINALKQRYQDQWMVRTTKIVVAEGGERNIQRPSKIFHDWLTDTKRIE